MSQVSYSRNPKADPTWKLQVWNETAKAGAWDGPYPLAADEENKVEEQKEKYLHMIMFTGNEYDY